MRRIWIFLLAATLASATPALAAGKGKGEPAARKDGATAAAATAAGKNAARNAGPANAAKPNNAGNAAVMNELDQLQSLIQKQARELENQRKQIEALQKQMNQGRSAVASVTAASPASAAAPASPAPVTTASLAAPVVAESPSRPSAAAQNEPKLGPLAFANIKMGVTFFGDYTFYNETGFGPQFMTQMNQEGPGNDHFNSFDVTRTYLNFVWTPNDRVTLRVTPNIYRQVDGSSGAIGNGSGAQIGGSTNGNLTLRLKYAYVDFNKLFSGAFAKDKLTFGQTQIPLVDWEEGLYGYRFTSLVPWNYLSLSSTYVGAKIHGPIMSNGKEYLDYDLGLFNSTSFHHIEQSANKEVMGRLTFYPTGTTKDRTGFGVTLFEDYGYSNKTPDTRAVPLNRFSAIVFYQTLSKSAQVAFEYDLGRNAMSAGNLFSGAQPVSGGLYGVLASAASAALSGDHTRQQGFDFFGHVKLGNSPFALFGLFQHFQPNTNYDYASDGFTANPTDFNRTVAGISYKVNKHFDFALGDENFHWIHPQGLLGAKDTNGIAVWTQFNY